MRYYYSATRSRWIVYISMYVFMMFMSGYLYRAIIQRQTRLTTPYGAGTHYIQYQQPDLSETKYPFDVPSWSSLWSMGFGKLAFETQTKVPPPWCSLYHSPQERRICTDVGEEVFHMFIATIPQLLVSLAYLELNYHLTRMIQLRDWTRLAIKRQGLRVSNPEPNSDQVSTHWLSLPYLYSIPALISAAFLNWLVSQSLFFYRHRAYDNDGERFIYYKAEGEYQPYTGDTQVFQGLGYSVLGIICSLLFGTIVFIISLVIGLQKCPPGPPSGPSNSLVVAVACHPPANDRHASRAKVRWGAISNGNSGKRPDSPQHCTITSRSVEDPVIGNWYE